MRSFLSLLCLLAVCSLGASAATPVAKPVEQDQAILLATQAFLKKDLKWRDDFRINTSFEAETGEWLVIFLKAGTNARSPGGDIFVYISKATGSIRTKIGD